MSNSLLRTAGSEEQTITTLEIAEMMGMEHGKLLRKLEGRQERGHHIKGYIEILNEAQMGVVDFFEKSTYKDGKGEIRPCYKVTKLGCEFLANKFTGEKGILFTAKYIKRFHEMEDMIRGNARAVEDFANTSYALKVPLVADWYERNKGRMERLCTVSGNSRKYLYHCILRRVSEKYDLDEAREIYKSEVGYYPVYAIDVVAYFPELAEAADRYLDRLEKVTYGEWG